MNPVDKSDNNKVFKNIPEDINAELLISYLPQDELKVVFEGTHNRNAYHDIVDLVRDYKDKPALLHLGRASLYDILPENMFHFVDRFDGLNEKKFEEAYSEQKKEQENARKFFSPIDLSLLQIRLLVREKIQECFGSDRLLILTIMDKERLNEIEKMQNRFVNKTIPFLPMCKTIRGNKALITLMLRKILMDEQIEIKIREESVEFFENPKDDNHAPRYPGVVGDSTLDSFYLGDSFVDDVLVYEVHYWSDEVCDQHFMEFVNDMEVFRQFVQDYFFAIGTVLRFDINTNADGLYLDDGTRHQYLNYNTNL